MSNENSNDISYNSILRDIFDSPTCLKTCIDSYFENTYKVMFRKIRALLKTLRISRILFVGSAFNYFASFIVKNCLGTAPKQFFKFSWESFEISEFYDYILPKKFDDGILYIFLSKSGQSRLLKKIIEHLNLLKIDPNLIWLVTNSPEVELTKYCGFVFPIHVKEEVVYATKSFQNTIFVLFLISQLLMAKDPLKDDNYIIYEKLTTDLLELKDNQNLIKRKVFDFLGYDFKFLYFISKGASKSSAYNSALLANSLYKLSAEGILLGHFFLGPFKVINNFIRCILLVNEDLGDGSKKLLHHQIKLITDQLGVLVLISNNTNLITELKYNSRVLSIPYKCELPALTPIFESFIIQILLLEFSKTKKIAY